MALLNDLKKILFGTKAVAKSAADKAYEAGKEAGKDLAESSGELFEKAKDKASEVGKIVLDKADQAMDKAGDLADDLGGKVVTASEALKARAKDWVDDKDDEPADGNDVMDDIIAETKDDGPALEEETLELPPLKSIPRQTIETAEQPEVEEDVFDALRKTAAGTGSAALVKSGDALEKAGGFTENVGKKVLETGGDLAGKLGQTAEKVGGQILDSSGKAMDKAADFTESVGKKIMDKGSDLADKFGGAAEDVGGAIFEKGGEALEKAKDLASGLGSKILKAKDDLVAKAEAEAAQSGETADSLIDKMKNLNQKLEDKISGNNAKFADKPLDTGGSEFSKHDSFWEKADRFAKGDYHMQGKTPKPGEMTIQDNPDYKAPDKGKVKGFDDLDGDGDELIDDAIVEE